MLIQKSVGNREDPVEIAIKKFSSHPSVKMISDKARKCSLIEFKEVLEGDVQKKLLARNLKGG